MRFIHDNQNHGKPTAIDSSEAGAQREPPCREWAVTLKPIRLKYIRVSIAPPPSLYK